MGGWHRWRAKAAGHRADGLRSQAGQRCALVVLSTSQHAQAPRRHITPFTPRLFTTQRPLSSFATAGEFFTPQQAEWAYEAHCPSVASCVLLARAGDRAATAIVIPRLATSQDERLLAGERRSAEELRAQIAEEMRSAAVAVRLRSWELPGRVLFDAGPWDEASGCCSAHGKLRRHVIARRHGLTTGSSGNSGSASAAADATRGVDNSGGDGGGDGDGLAIGRTVSFLCTVDDDKAMTMLPTRVRDCSGGDWWAPMRRSYPPL